MINGIFVPANGGPSDILPFRADAGAQSNFIPDDIMEESIQDAAKACQQQLTPATSLLQTVLPALAHPLNRFWSLLAVMSGAGCLNFSIGDLLWVFAPVTLPEFLLPGWKPFILFGLMLGSAMVFSLPGRQVLSNLRSLFTGWQHSEPLENFLHQANLKPQVGNQGQQYGHFFGPSAGLTFFCAFVEAVAHSGQQHIFPPWQQRLLGEMNRWVTSAALGPDQRLDTVGNLPEKLEAIWRYNHRHPQNGLILAVFSWRDFFEVETVWTAVAQENLQPKPGPSHSYLLADSRRANLTFLFCRSLRDFLYFLYPWAWQWLVLRMSAITAILILALFVQPPTPPEFTLECEPRASLSQPGIYAIVREPGQPVSCNLQLISQGFPRPFFPPTLGLNVESNADRTISADLGGEFDKQFSLTMRQDSELFFLVLPPDLSPNEVVVVVTMLNRAGKFAQVTIFLTPR